MGLPLYWGHRSFSRLKNLEIIALYYSAQCNSHSCMVAGKDSVTAMRVRKEPCEGVVFRCI